MTLPSLRKRRTTRPNTLRWTVIDSRTTRQWALCLAACAVGSQSGWITAAEPAKPAVEQAALNQWEPVRTNANTKSVVAPPRFQATRFDSSIRPVAGEPFGASQVPPADAEFLKPLAVASQLQPVPDGPLLTTEDSAQTIFRPITEIRPYHNYSVLAKSSNEYLCPQPENIPKGQQVACPNVLPMKPTGSLERYYSEINFQWCPSNLAHAPLYFEDVPLERYGHTFWEPVQPFVSLGKFGVDVLALPYTMALDNVHETEYALGYYRPGDCAPELLYQPPLNAHAAATAGGIYTGIFFLFP